MNEHNLPWRLSWDASDGDVNIVPIGGNVDIATVWSNANNDAEYIVEACNNYEALKKENEQLVKIINDTRKNLLELQACIENVKNTSSKQTMLILRLVRTVQRLEREGADLTIEDVKLVKNAKTFLGYSVPDSLEEGTGSMVLKEDI